MNRVVADGELGYGQGSALRPLGISDSAREQDFDDIVAYVARTCDVPAALITLIDDDCRWLKAPCGFEAAEALDQAIHLHAAEEPFLEIHDTTADPRTRDNALCQGSDPVRYYAGALLRLDDGTTIGALCVLDTRRRRLSEDQRDTLILLARQVVRQIQLHEALAAQKHLRSEIDHRVKNSLQMVTSYLRLQRRAADDAAGEVIRRAERQVAAIVELHGALHHSGSEGTVDLGAYLERIASLLTQTLPANVALESHFAPAVCASERAAAAGVIVNEFVANSAKHAFPDDSEGVVRLQGRFDGSHYRLILSDDGIGRPETAERGVGLSIMEAAARQLSADVIRPDDVRGTVLAATFRASPVQATIARAG